MTKLPEYLAEFFGTALMVFGGLSAVVCFNSPPVGLIEYLPDPGQRRLLTGLCFAATGSLVAVSPLGRLSGGHINPAVSLAFYLEGKMHGRDLLAYSVAQLSGGLLGAVLLVFAWGRAAAAVGNGMTRPGLGYSAANACLAEIGITALLVFAIFVFLSCPRLLRWTPLMTWLLVAAMVWQEAPISGTSLNPARSFGPALVSHDWADQWVYLVGPGLGSVLGWAAFGLLTPKNWDVLTGKLFHAPRHRSLFKNTAAPAKPLPGVSSP